MPASLNISAPTQRTDVPSATTRKCERRYGVVHPERTPGGQRRYTERDVARVEWLKERLHEGYRIGEAAALEGDSVTVCAHRRGAAGRDRCDRRDRRERRRRAPAAFDQSPALTSLHESFVDVLAPALAVVGDRWACGEVSVAQEHLASSIVRAALTLLSGQRPEIRGTAVLACAPGEGHEVALLMLAVLLRLDGRQVAYLEADTPYADTVRLADDLDARALCFSAALRASAAVLDDEPAAAPQRESLLLCVGGRATETSDLRQAVNRLHVHTA